MPRALAAFVMLGLLAALISGLGASPAFADNQQVNVKDNVFLLPAVAVKPNESVTWSYANGADHHNVHFDDGSFLDPQQPAFAPWVTTRTFLVEGTFRYHCDEHGGPGGIGMSGIVYVNSSGTVPGTPPTASFTATPGLVAVNQNVAFSAAGSTDPDSMIVRYEWDLDGDDVYEVEGPQTARTYATPGTRTVALRITDSQGLISVATRSVTVDAPPTAAFRASPNPAQTGQPVTFDGAGSSDPDGAVVRYEWDLDGDGSFETDTGNAPATARSYANPTAVSAGLRVTDDRGFSTTTTRALSVVAPPAAPPAVAPAPAVPADPCAVLIWTSFRQVGSRELARVRLVWACVASGCRGVAGRGGRRLAGQADIRGLGTSRPLCVAAFAV